jgi:O-antigen/teichoic acid export membrane protein
MAADGKARGLVLRNAAASVGQILVSGVALFLLFRFLLASLGPARLGVWSLVLAATSASRISDLGFAASTVKFLARELGRGDRSRAPAVIETALVASGAAVGLMVLALFPVIAWALPRFISADLLQEALQILPWSLASMWFGVLGAAAQAGLDGSLRADLRALIVTAGNVAFVGLAAVLARPYGLVGLAWAQVAQGAAVAIGSWVILRRQIPGLRAIPRRMDLTLLREMARYGASFQVVTIASMLVDPTTKFIMARFGSLDLVGYFEMAGRIVSQLRQLVVGSIQVLVPVIARLHEEARNEVGRIYLRSYALVTYLAVPFFGMIAVGVPLLSWYWNGTLVPSFVVVAELTNLGWAANTFIVPAYFANLGTGNLRWNTVTHLAIGGLNVVLGLALGVVVGGIGAVAGWTLAMILGSALLAFGFSRTNQIPLGHLLPSGSTLPMVAAIAIAITGTLLASGIGPWESSWQLALAALLGSGAAMTAVVWAHPERPALLALVTRR